MHGNLDWVVWLGAAGVALLNLWLVLRFVSFIRTVEELLTDIEQHAAKTADSPKKVGG